MLGLLLQILLYISVPLTHVWFTAPNIDCINMDTRLTFYIIPYTNLILSNAIFVSGSLICTLFCLIAVFFPQSRVHL